jgi:hypothetical protein
LGDRRAGKVMPLFERNKKTQKDKKSDDDDSLERDVTAHEGPDAAQASDETNSVYIDIALG